MVNDAQAIQVFAGDDIDGTFAKNRYDSRVTRWADSCGGRASTNCLNCSTCSWAKCRLLVLDLTQCGKWLAIAPGTCGACPWSPGSRACGKSAGGLTSTSIRTPEWTCGISEIKAFGPIYGC